MSIEAVPITDYVHISIVFFSYCLCVNILTSLCSVPPYVKIRKWPGGNLSVGM